MTNDIIFLLQYKIWTITRLYSIFYRILPGLIKTTGDSINSTVTGNSKIRFWILSSPSPTGNSLKVRLESINDENDKVFSRIGDCSQLKEFVQKIFKTCMNPAERVLKMIKNFEKITFRKWKKWWNQKMRFSPNLIRVYRGPSPNVIIIVNNQWKIIRNPCSKGKSCQNIGYTLIYKKYRLENSVEIAENSVIWKIQ